MRGNVITIFVSTFGFLAVLAGSAFMTGFDKAISAGLYEPTTPVETYISGVRLGDLQREAFSLEVGSIVENLGDEELVFWLSDEEYYSYPLKKLGFDPDPVKIEKQVFERIPDGFGPKPIMIRHISFKKGVRLNIPLELDEEKVREFLELLKGNVDRETLDAHYDFEASQLIDSVAGVEIDIDATIARIPSHIDAVGPVVSTLVVAVMEPRVLTADLQGIDPTIPLASFTTKYNRWKKNRCKNIGKLAEMFRGVTINPGETFSFNDVSGPRNYKTGYFSAPEYRNNRVIDGFGGGSCQVSTTLYNAALHAGLQIDERHPHSRVVFYVPRGMDATVNYDSSVDLQFTNVLDHPVVIWPRFDIKEGWLTFDMFGHPDDRQEIEITNSYSTIWRTEDQDEYIEDSSVAPGEEVIEDRGTNGIRVRTFRHYILPDGSKITEQLFFDRIPAMGRIVLYNPSTPVHRIASSPEEQGDTEGDIDIYF